MAALKAFIGHSFSSNDETLVRIFLKFFDQIKELDIGFSWEHAEAAEAKELADKVLRLMQAKNLFIGICTQNEAAIQQENLKSTLFGKTFKASKDLFKPKASDWIIQEIGLAIGKGMDLILLVESGLRPPGGLQGNKEYIVFDRQSPHKSFGKVLEMIRSLIPKAKIVENEEADARAAAVEKGSEPSQEKDWLKPEPGWRRVDFEHALWRSILLGDKDIEQEIDQAYLETDEGRDSQKRNSWEAYHELALLRFGIGGQITKLDQLAADHPDNSDVLMYRAEGYQRYGEHEKAARYFEAAAQKAGNPSDKLERYGDVAIAFTNATRREQAQRIIEQMKSMVPDGENGELTLLSTLRVIANTEKSDDEYCCLTEKILDLRPGDFDLRFSLAYKYSEKGDEELSLYHYLKIPYQERTSVTWNNLGVQFDHFELVYKSVEAYRRSEEHGETLAMSNLAQKLLKAGFLKEAEDICNRAIGIKDYHKNIGLTISRIKGLPEEEQKKVEEIQQRTNPLSEFFKNYGHALAKSTVEDHHGRWQGQECELKITIQGTSFKAEGIYERTYSPGLIMLALGNLGNPQKVTTKYSVRYEGSIHGKAVTANYTTTSEDDPPKTPTILGGGANSGRPVLMILSDSLQEIQIYEKTDKERKFYKFTRLS